MTADETHVLNHLFAVVRRRWPVMLALTGIGLVLAGFYAETIAPVYRASATIMVRSGAAITADFSRPVTITPEEEGLFLSQMELAKSGAVALETVKRTGIHKDASFCESPLSGLNRLLVRLRGEDPAALGLKRCDPSIGGDMAVADAAARLRSQMSVTRLGRTYVANLTMSSHDPALAQTLANGWADAFDAVIAAEQDLTAKARAQGFDVELAAMMARRSGLTGPALEALDRQIDALTLKAAEARAAAAVPSVDVTILNRPGLPAAPVEPRKSFILTVGLILGAGLGALLAGLFELRDTGLRAAASVRALGLAWLGHLPVVRDRNRAAPSPFTGSELSGVAGTRGIGRETLDRIEVAAIHAGAKVIGVASVGKGDGATVLAANLALHLADGGKRVTLIDAADGPKGLTARLTSKTGQGLMDCLLGDLKPDAAEQHHGPSNLVVLAHGADGRRVNAAGLLAGNGFERLLDDLKGRNDWVVIDCGASAGPAFAAVNPRLDGVVLAARWGKTEAPAAKAAGDLVTAQGGRLLGLVLNRVKTGRVMLYD